MNYTKTLDAQPWRRFLCFVQSSFEAKAADRGDLRSWLGRTTYVVIICHLASPHPRRPVAQNLRILAKQNSQNLLSLMFSCLSMSVFLKRTQSPVSLSSNDWLLSIIELATVLSLHYFTLGNISTWVSGGQKSWLYVYRWWFSEPFKAFVSHVQRWLDCSVSSSGDQTSSSWHSSPRSWQRSTVWCSNPNVCIQRWVV